MIQFDEASVILLTYKGKILLTLFENDPHIFNDPYLIKKHDWNFIAGTKHANESFQDAILKTVEGITNIKLSSVEFLSTELMNDKKRYLYHAKLSDSQVNCIERADGHLLQFFSFKELESLPLSELTKLFISKHRDFLENVYQAPVRN